MTERDFITYWKNTDFSEYNEMDVREEFISQLLHLLGYSKNTVNNIIREKTLQLTQPFQRVGRKRIQIDYAPTIRLKSFWILEAKPGNVKEMDEGDLLQAYLYASHPEIQAEYIVLCNGWKLMVYDVHQVKDWDIPFFEISNEDCDSKFQELKQILSAKTMLEYRRNQLLQQIHNTFEVELDLDQWKRFVRNFEKMKRPIEARIEENVWELQRKEYEKREKKRKEELQQADPKRLIGWMESAGRRNAQWNKEYCRRIDSADTKQRASLIKLLMQHYWGRCHAEFKCECLAVLLHVVEENIEVAPEVYGRKTTDILCEVIQGNLTYHSENPFQNALDYLDKLCHKFAYIVIRSSSMGSISKIIQDAKINMAIEEFLVERPTVAGKMVPLINIFIDYLWFYLSRENTVQDIWRNSYVLQWGLQKLEILDLPQYPDHDDDFLWYELYGDHHDYLFQVSHSLLSKKMDVVEGLELTEEIKHILSLEEKEALKFIPKMPCRKQEPTKQEQDRVVEKIIAALFQAIDLWRELEQK